MFYLIGLTSQYINNTEEKKTRENYKKSQNSWAQEREAKKQRSEGQEGKLLKENIKNPEILKLKPHSNSRFLERKTLLLEEISAC